MTKLYLAIPCYNEEEVLYDTTEKLTRKFDKMIAEGKISSDSKIYYFDDGSKDKTWEIITELHRTNKYVNGIKMSRNRGHQNTLLGGLLTIKDRCDCTISIDADLQDDINAFDQMIEDFENGSEIVYGVRSKRATDTAFKRITAQGFYKILSVLGAEVVYNHADFRLISRKALNALAEFEEVNLFLRGLVPLVGFKSSVVEYERSERLAGESKYPLKKMLGLAWDGVTSLSLKPIRMITSLGAIVFGVSLIILIYSFVMWCIGNTVSGWTSTVLSIWAIGGLQLLAIGVIGEYIGKIYMETKKRPRYIVEEELK
ncbi:MAG: glycosyltransferase family 2 protein [Clostridia bacterium]|nr:glycosyltransferase family 2 protein [Clostridia bacterium]